MDTHEAGDFIGATAISWAIMVHVRPVLQHCSRNSSHTQKHDTHEEKNLHVTLDTIQALFFRAIQIRTSFHEKVPTKRPRLPCHLQAVYKRTKYIHGINHLERAIKRCLQISRGGHKTPPFKKERHINH